MSGLEVEGPRPASEEKRHDPSYMYIYIYMKIFVGSFPQEGTPDVDPKYRSPYYGNLQRYP